ncbi:MAG: sulfite exporter TauE/SafE family protein [Euzebyales bacterium]|nr:sulfite exporter TauE/SafE family protein [Euzebyales bacterium]
MRGPLTSTLVKGLGLGVVAGVLSGLFGIGGGAVLVPLLVLVMGMAQHPAHATSLAAIILTAISGTVAFAAEGEVAYRAGALISAGAIVGAFAGAGLMHRLSPRRLRQAFALLLVVTAVQLLLGLQPVSGGGDVDGLPLVAATLLLGLAAGALSALMGVGGGVIMVPAMVLLLGFSQHLAEGTSLLIIVPTAVVGSLRHARHGYTDWKLGLLIGLGGIAGAQLGSFVALALEADVLQRLFAVFLLVTGVRLLWKSRGGEQPAGAPAQEPAATS